MSNSTVVDHLAPRRPEACQLGCPERTRPTGGASIIRGLFLKNGLERNLPEYARKHLDAGLEGDVDAAASLVYSAPNEYRGHIAVAAYLSGTPYDAYREILTEAWSLDHGSVAEAARVHRVPVRRMMKAGRFPHPFTGQVRAYRGTSGIPRWRAQQGVSWTIDPDVAAWFACRRASDDRKPVVVSVSVDASDIIFYDNGRSEQEVILARPVLAAVEGDLASWFAATTRRELKTRRDNESLLSRSLVETNSSGV